jgi:glycosyltransferase involved in cell wall biosynthesis
VACAQDRSSIAAVISTYNEEKHIGDIARRTRQQLNHVLVVDDGQAIKLPHARAKPARRW